MKKLEIPKPYFNFGLALHDVRVGLNLSQAALARKIFCEAQFISNAERGLCLLPPKQTKLLIKLINKTQASLAYAHITSLQEGIRKDFANHAEDKIEQLGFEVLNV